MRLEPALQVRLLAMAERRTRIDSAGARREALDERAEVDRLRRRAAAGRAASSHAHLAVRNLDLQVKRAAHEAARWRHRESDERAALRTVTDARRRRELERGLAATERRRAAAEAEVDRLESRRAAEARQDDESRGDVAGELAAAERALAAAEEALDAEEERIVAEIARLREGLPAKLLAAFDRREAEVGVAVARLEGRMSMACFMELPHSITRELEALPVDEMPECPESGAWLVRAKTIAAAGGMSVAGVPDVTGEGR